MSIPAKALERIKTSLKRFQPILQSARTRDVNESDTVVIVTDMLDYVFGYDKFSEITSEYSIRGTYCDLAVKLDGKIAFLIEVKAIGLELKEPHVKQAVDYAANQGIEWVGLTNGIEWRIYKVGFQKPISADLVLTFNLLDVNVKKSADLGALCLLAKEGWQRDHLEQHHNVQQIINKFTFSAVILSEPVLDVIKRQIRRISSDVKISDEEIRNILMSEVLKRETLDGEKATQAAKLVAKAEKKALRKTKPSESSTESISELPEEYKEKLA